MSESAIDVADLLHHERWMRHLARSLVRDEHRAEDLVQQAWLEILQNPRGSVQAAGSFLASMLRSIGGHARRAEARRIQREAAAARPEGFSSDPHAVLERLELRQKVVEQVCLLEEPYRSTVLLRFFEEMSVKAIARRQDVPADTVKTRLRRGLDLLRSRLDRLYGGDRKVWCSAILPLAGWGTASTAGGGVPSQVAAVGGGGSGAASSCSAAAKVIAGGVLMSYKTMVTAGAVGVLALAAGIGVGARWMRMGPQEAMERYSLVPKSQLLADRDRATVEIDALKAARRDLERDRKDLADRLALAKAERTAGKTSSQSGGPSEKLPVAFGKFAGLEALSRADWQTLAQTMAHVQSYMSARQEKRKQGEPGDLDKEFWEENDKLVKFAATLVGKMPTNQWGVGEFTHPIVVANFTAALLEAAGVPLSEEQRAEVASAGAEYEKEYAKVQEGYGSDAIRLEKVLDELDLKQASATAMRKVLTPEQLDFLAPSDLRDRAWIKESMGADCLSPSVMAMTLARAEYLDSASAVREEIPRKIADGYGLDEAQRAAAAPAFEAWYRSIERTLEPVSRQDPTSIDAVIAAGRAQEALRKDLLALPGLSEKARTAIADDPGWFLPMVEKKQ